jgi:hypothetical protein
MPLLETVERFIVMVEDNKHDTAIEEFYTEHASMQENQAEPRKGRDNLVGGERKVLMGVKSMISKCIRPVFIDGDHVVIRWVFNFVWKNDTTTRIEEIAYQRWEGERIAEETFFYDPAQRNAK